MEKILSKKKILIVSEYFYPEEFKINEVALAWKEKGYDVDVLTTVPSYPRSKIYAGYKNKFYQKDRWQDINIYRVKAVTGYKTSLIKKLLKYFSFMFFGSIASLFIGKKYDYVFGFDIGSLTCMAPAVLLKKYYNKKVTLWIQDIWPDSVYAYGFKKTKVLKFFLEAFVKFIYKYTDNFAVSSNGFKNKILPYIVNHKSIECMPSWADGLDKSLPPFEFSNDKKIHFTFAGNVGKVQNLDNVIKAFGSLDASLLEKSQLNIIGDGSHLGELKKLVEKNNFKNIVFWGRKPRDEMYRYFSASDFLIVSLIDKPIFSLTVPAKVQTYIAANKPILAIINGDAADIIKENTLGYASNPNDIEEIQKIFIQAINTDKTKREQFTKNCKSLTDTIFNKDIIINKLLKLLTQEIK
jgi:glycosyltransferase involved in cell wall biosynthesis